VTTYKDLDASLTGRNAKGRKLGNNTYAERREGLSAPAIAVRLHATDVLTFYQDGRVVLNTGGWKTVTTKDRINEYIPAGFRVLSIRGTWYLYRAPRTDDESAITVPYADGLAIGARGGITGDGPKDAPKQETKLRKDVAAYAAAFIAALDAGQVSPPGPGDCFYCAMRETKTGAPLGEATRNAEHIRSHMAESYYVPSLLVRALETFGASVVCRSYVWGCMNGSGGPNDSFGDIGREQAEKMLRRYVTRQLGMSA